MVIEQPREVGQPRRKVWCSSTEITAQGENYKFNDLPIDALGFGSVVYVIDDKKILLYDDATGILYDWTDYLSGGELE